MSPMQRDLLDRFRWVDGHADIWRLFADGAFFPRLAAALADPFRSIGVTHVAGIEARGFLLGGVVAVELAAGFVAIRKEGGLFPGGLCSRATPPDYRGRTRRLLLQRHALGAGDRVLLVDDWSETGAQALTARALVEAAGATFLGLSVIVDELPAAVRGRFPAFSALVPAAALGPSG